MLSQGVQHGHKSVPLFVRSLPLPREWAVIVLPEVLRKFGVELAHERRGHSFLHVCQTVQHRFSGNESERTHPIDRHDSRATVQILKIESRVPHIRRQILMSKRTGIVMSLPPRQVRSSARLSNQPAYNITANDSPGRRLLVSATPRADPFATTPTRRKRVTWPDPELPDKRGLYRCQIPTRPSKGSAVIPEGLAAAPRLALRKFRAIHSGSSHASRRVHDVGWNRDRALLPLRQQKSPLSTSKRFNSSLQVNLRDLSPVEEQLKKNQETISNPREIRNMEFKERPSPIVRGVLLAEVPDSLAEAHRECLSEPTHIGEVKDQEDEVEGGRDCEDCKVESRREVKHTHKRMTHGWYDAP